MKSDTLKKHHFWLLFGAVPLLVGLLVIMLYTGPAEAIGTQEENYKKRKGEVGSAKASGTGFIAALGEQKTTLEERRGQLWGVNYERQKDEGVFAWPSVSKDRYLKDLEKLDLRFGAKEVPALEAGKDPGTQFVVLNDEMAKFTDSKNYLESYTRMTSVVAPTRFEGGWNSVLRHVTNWGTGRPESNLFWLALEDFWIQRALLKPIAEVNAKSAKFELVKPAMGPDTPLKRKFQNRTWEIDVEVATEGPNRVIKSKLKNKTDRLQMLGLNKTMRLKVWLDDPKLSNSQYFEYRIGGELVKGSGELTPKVVPEIHKIPAGTDPAQIYAIEQILDEITVPVRLVRKVELGYRDSKRSAAELKLPSFFPEDAAPAEVAQPGIIPPAGEEGRGPLGGLPAGGAAARTGTAEQVLNANRKRYIERTEQVRRMPVGLVLVVDQAFVNDVLIALGNSPLRFQITQTQWQRFRDPLAVSAAPSSSPAPSGSPGGFSRPSYPGGEEEEGGQGRSSFSPPPMFPGSSGGGTAPTAGALPQSQVTAGLVELAVYGLVSLYEKPSVKPVDPNAVPEPKPDAPEPMIPAPKPEEPKPPMTKPEEPKPTVPKVELPAPKPPADAPTSPPK